MVKQSPHKRWKGHCLLCCGGIKIRGAGWSVKAPASALRGSYEGQAHRVSRHWVPDRDDLVDEDTDPYDTDCQHGCNGTCFVSGSERCNFTCHPGLRSDAQWLEKYT